MRDYLLSNNYPKWSYVLAIVSPGQGSQSQKMLDNWLNDESVNDEVTKLSKLLNFDFIYLGTMAQQDEINLTQNTQPLLVLNSLISFDKLNLTSRQLEKTVFAGHSVGEIVSYCLSGIISKSEALEISILRGKSMANQINSQNQTGMAAILGELNETLMNLIETFDLQVANKNSSQQIVVGGEIENINKLIDTKPNGVRIIKLSVSAAFHTNFMINSLHKFQTSIEKYNFKNPTAKVISNFDGLEITTGTDAFNKLIGQLTNSVRWDLCQKKFIELGVTGLLELCPGGVLTGISKRENPSIETFSIKNPSDITSANEFIAKHA